MSLIPKTLTCPTCKWKGANVKLENGACKCPNCGRVVFRYLDEGEAYNRDTFMKSLNTERGKKAAHDAAVFFPNAKPKMKYVVAGAFVGYVWQHLDKALGENTDDSA